MNSREKVDRNSNNSVYDIFKANIRDTLPTSMKSYPNLKKSFEETKPFHA